MNADTFDEEHVRQFLRHYLEVTNGCRVEILMKDNHTMRNRRPAHGQSRGSSGTVTMRRSALL